MFQPNRKPGRTIASIVACLVLVLGSALILIFKQTILDYIVVWQFKPSSEIETIATRDMMSGMGKFMFYTSQPEVDSAANFNEVCNRQENTTSILGCFSNSRIYIYDVVDPKLDGIREVTAAHEMLHAVYSRMSDSEKVKINALLEAEYAKIQNKKEFSDLIAFYARTEPGERDNELHSVIGTEVASLDPQLEAHYAEYFTNRQAVVGFYDKYNGVFKELATRAALLATELTTLSDQISYNSTKYNSDVQQLNSDISAFNQKASKNQFISQSQFNNERNSLTSRVAALTSDKAQIDSDIVKYNKTLTEYNSIATQSTQLYNSIDSTLVSAPSV